ncbi:hypothetical protein THAOC_22045, partial [Thalassiosira oceanica]
ASQEDDDDHKGSMVQMGKRCSDSFMPAIADEDKPIFVAKEEIKDGLLLCTEFTACSPENSKDDDDPISLKKLKKLKGA